MGIFDDHVAIMGDWMPPSPSPRAFFSSLISDDIGARPAIDSNSGNRSGNLFPEPEQHVAYGNADKQEQSGAGVGGEEKSDSNALGEPGLSSRGGLLERIAARAGFNAPRLNTESIRHADMSKKPEVRSPYLTIPAGLSPTTLLDSPVFLSNMVQPSPTTGTFLFASTGNNEDSTLPQLETDSLNNSLMFQEATFGKSHLGDNGSSNLLTDQTQNSFGNVELSPPFDEQHEDGDQRNSSATGGGGGTAEDGYNWRKYGQKHVKGSEYPRSYFKCTHPNCPIKKNVERSHEGHITEIIYKGAHNHPKPHPSRRSNLGSSNSLSDVPLDSEQPETGADPVWSNMQNGSVTAGWKPKILEPTSSEQLVQDFVNGATMNLQTGGPFESGDGVDGSTTFSNDEDDDDRATHGSVSLGYDGEGDELESKRRRIGTYVPEMSGATRAIREPRVVVQTTSEVDILDDGYRWRKYGQKVVKGNPNPRSYYKCTSNGCNVRKHVERASHDLKAVITTYEGKHNHDVPAARNSAHANSSGSNTLSTQQAPATTNHLHRPSYSLPPARPQPVYGFGIPPSRLAGLGLAGFEPDQGKLPVFPVHPSLGHHQRRPMNDMGYMLPKGEPKTEPITDTGLNASNASAVYQQLMSQLPLGPQM